MCRFGKKAGRNRKDLLKAIHYIVLLMSSEDKMSEDVLGYSSHDWRKNTDDAKVFDDKNLTYAN